MAHHTDAGITREFETIGERGGRLRALSDHARGDEREEAFDKKQAIRAARARGVSGGSGADAWDLDNMSSGEIWDALASFGGSEADRAARFKRNLGVGILEENRSLEGGARSGGLLDVGNAQLPEAARADMAASRRALTQLQGRASGYISPEERAREQAMRGEAEGRQAGAAGAAMQATAETGGGAAGQYASQMANQQFRNQFGSQWQNDIAGQREQTRQGALEQLGQLSGGYRRQSFGEAESRGAVGDFNRRFDARYRGDIEARNAERIRVQKEQVAAAEMGKAGVHQRRNNSSWSQRNAPDGGGGGGGGGSGYDDENEYG